MLGSEAAVRTVAAFLGAAACGPVVCDPVLVSSSGAPLLEPAALQVRLDY